MATDEIVHVSSLEAPPLVLRLSELLGRLAGTIGKWATLFMLPMVGITVWDVFQRKAMKFVGDIMLDQGWLDARNWMYGNLLEWLPFRSTLLQELEWHFHVANFALVLGYGYIYNRHVRVDLVREKLSFRNQAWVEFIGVSLFMIPFCLIVAYFSVDYVASAFTTNEQSSSLVGLSHRWAIKSVLVFGLLLAATAGFAVWLQVVFALFGPRNYKFPCYVIEDDEEKVERRKIIEGMDATFGDGTSEAKRGNSTKLMSRQIDDAAMKHQEGTAGQIIFTGLAVVVMLTILVLIFHTFDFWRWLI